MMIPMSALLRSSTVRFVLVALVPGSLLLAHAVPAVAQDGDIDGVISRPVVQSLPSRGSYELNAALTRLAANPRDVNALIDAGNAALALGDSEAAMGFLGRADQLSPANPRVKATLASAMVRNENPYDAIPLFDAAERAGATDAMLAGDRGLAYDLVGDNPSAQRFYRQALAAMPAAGMGGEQRDEITRRLALSLAIEGDRKGFETTLLSQLRAPDTAAWRTRAFGLAILGDHAEAVKIAYGTMTRDLADAMAPYLRYMVRLTPAQQAAAANFGHFPRASQVGRDDPRAAVFASAVTRRPRSADAGLVPEGKPLGGKAATAKADSSKASRKRKRDSSAVAVAIAPPASALRPGPTPTPAARPAPTPAARPAAPTVRIAAATPTPVFRPPTIFTPAASPTPLPSPKPDPQPTLTLNPVPRPTPAAPPAANPVSGLPPSRIAAVTPPPSAATPAPARTLTPSPAPGNFDLAALGQKPAAASAPAVAATAPDPTPAPRLTPTPAPTPAARPRLADIFSDFQPPEDESQNAVAAVDIGKIVAARSKSADARTDIKADARGPLPGAPTGTRRSAPVETPASAKAGKAAGNEKAKPSAPTHPSRIWIQLAAGRDKAALGFDWRKQTRASADLFKTRKGWTTPWGQTNRLLVGPFESQAAATTFLKELKKKDTDAFVWTSPAGQAIDALAAK